MALAFALFAGACNVSTLDDGRAIDVDCSPYKSCGTCTPVLGCGWCFTGNGNGLCTTGPEHCSTAPGGWSWETTGCHNPADAAVAD